jgi:uncharacterized protein (TIGR03086 family)
MSEIADRYRRRADAFEATIVGTSSDRWASPSPCERWVARDVVAHVVEMHGIVLRAGAAEPTGKATAAFDPLAAFREARADAERALDDPDTAPALAQEIDEVVSLDLPQHGWDLATATGQEATMDPRDLDELWAVLSPQGPEWWAFMREPGSFGPGIEVYGPEVAISADAPLQDRLLGLLGRNPAWVPPHEAAPVTSASEQGRRGSGGRP